MGNKQHYLDFCQMLEKTLAEPGIEHVPQDWQPIALLSQQFSVALDR